MAYIMRHQVINNPQGQVKYWIPPDGGREHYHLGVWIEGEPEDLDAIAHVEYLLHPSFKQPLRRSANRGNKFGITFWTWGMFEIRVVVVLHDGSRQELSYYLTYELPADTGENYVQVADYD